MGGGKHTALALSLLMVICLTVVTANRGICPQQVIKNGWIHSSFSLQYRQKYLSHCGYKVDISVQCKWNYYYVPGNGGGTPSCVDGNWKNIGMCKACSPEVPNGHFEYERMVVCDKGYAVSPEVRCSAWCLANGKWSHSCQAIPNYCNAMTINNYRIPGGRLGSQGNIQCPSGQYASSYPLCTAGGHAAGSGVWIGTAACDPIVADECRGMFISNGQVAAGSINSSAQITCHNGYYASSIPTCEAGSDSTQSKDWQGDAACTLIPDYCPATTYQNAQVAAAKKDTKGVVTCPYAHYVTSVPMCGEGGSGSGAGVWKGTATCVAYTFEVTIDPEYKGLAFNITDFTKFTYTEASTHCGGLLPQVKDYSSTSMKMREIAYDISRVTGEQDIRIWMNGYNGQDVTMQSVFEKSSTRYTVSSASASNRAFAVCVKTSPFKREVNLSPILPRNSYVVESLETRTFVETRRVCHYIPGTEWFDRLKSQLQTIVNRVSWALRQDQVDLWMWNSATGQEYIIKGQREATEPPRPINLSANSTFRAIAVCVH